MFSISKDQLFCVHLKKGIRAVRVENVEKNIQKCGITDHRRPAFGLTLSGPRQPAETRSNRDDVAKNLADAIVGRFRRISPT